MVLGIDPHKKSHTAVAVEAATGEIVGELTVLADRRGRERLLGETAGAERFASSARFAMHAGVAPLPASSGNTQRYRLNRRGNRQLNAALHRMAVTQMRTHEPAQAYLARKRAEGKSKREALRCLKRHLARTVWQTLRASEERRKALLTAIDPSAPQLLALAS
jgi:transposase